MTNTEPATGTYPDRCFACDRELSANRYLVQTIDGQKVYVGRECHGKVVTARREGYQPPLGGPRLFALYINPEWVA